MSTPSSQLVWFITGTSSGIGRELVIAALKRGDKVIATTRARSLAQLDDLKAMGAEVLELDVSAPPEEIKSVAATAVAKFGRVDVVVNNAGYLLVGTFEEITPEEVLHQLNTNVFGALNVTRAFLPYLREQKAGTIAFIGSLGGWIPSAGVSIYAATKSYIRSISMSLHEEIAPLGLRSVCFDPGLFRTLVYGSNNLRLRSGPRVEDYKTMDDQLEKLARCHPALPGDPKKCAGVIVDVVRGEGAAEGKAFPKVLLLGSDCYGLVKEQLESYLEGLEEWKEVTSSTEYV